MTITALTPASPDLTRAQQRTAKARATRTKKANDRAAARLREAGYFVIHPECLPLLQVVLEGYCNYGNSLLTPTEVRRALGNPDA